MNVLVTGAGGPAGICCIKALKDKHKVIATDMDSYASGLYLADRGYVVSRCNDARYFNDIADICERESIDFIYPTVEEELFAFSQNKGRFVDKGIAVAVADGQAIKVATNKSQTYALLKHRAYCPDVYSPTDIYYPCVVKPANSRGSRGFYVCGNSMAVEVALKRNEDYGNSIIMEYLEGPEYSVYGLTDLDHTPLITFANKRMVAKGESKVAEITTKPSICVIAEEIASTLGLVGPWNVQLIETADGPKLVEVNPRIGGSASLLQAAGVDYIGMIADVFLRKPIDVAELTWKPTVMIRYNEEVFLSPGDVLKQ